MVNRVGTINNLETDGTYDLLLMSFPNGFPQGSINFAIDNTPRRVTGIQKVAQMFLVCLLTTKGTDPIRNQFGTDFSDYSRFSNIGNDSDEVLREVTSSIRDAERQIVLLTNTGGKDRASQLQSVNVLNIDVQGDATTLYLKLLTRAGEEGTVAVPFPQTDLGTNDG